MSEIDLSIIVPVYNERENISSFLTDLEQKLIVAKMQAEVIIVDDGSTDDTARLARNHLQAGLPGFLIQLPQNMGKGEAVTRGIKDASGGVLIVIDGDGALSASYVPLFFEKLHDYHVVLGVKKGYPFTRLVFSYSFNVIIRLLFHVPTRDALCGIKGFQTDVARPLFADLTQKRWLYDVEVLRKIPENCSVLSVPVYVSRNPDTKFRVLDPLRMLYTLLKMRFRN